MENLKASLIIILGLVFFSSCAPKYGCPYGMLEETEIIPTPAEKVVVVERTIADLNAVAIAR